MTCSKNRDPEFIPREIVTFGWENVKYLKSVRWHLQNHASSSSPCRLLPGQTRGTFRYCCETPNTLAVLRTLFPSSFSRFKAIYIGHGRGCWRRSIFLLSRATTEKNNTQSHGPKQRGTRFPFFAALDFCQI